MRDEDFAICSARIRILLLGFAGLVVLGAGSMALYELSYRAWGRVAYEPEHHAFEASARVVALGVISVLASACAGLFALGLPRSIVFRNWDKLWLLTVFCALTLGSSHALGSYNGLPAACSSSWSTLCTRAVEESMRPRRVALAKATDEAYWLNYYGEKARPAVVPPVPSRRSVIDELRKRRRIDGLYALLPLLVTVGYAFRLARELCRPARGVGGAGTPRLSAAVSQGSTRSPR